MSFNFKIKNNMKKIFKLLCLAVASFVFALGLNTSAEMFWNQLEEKDQKKEEEEE